MDNVKSFRKEDISILIHPIPKRVDMAEGQLPLEAGCKWRISAPQAEKGPVKTALESVKAFLTGWCGEDCFADTGIPVVLQLEQATPEVNANAEEGYRLSVGPDGVTVTGFGPSGLYYGAVSLTQLGSRGVLPCVEVLDWPDQPFRAYMQECRYGSNLMEKEDWFAMVDDLAAKKINRLSVPLYGCWVVQFGGRVAEYLYLPLKDYPQLQTPQQVYYYSPNEGRWVTYETLPPIYRDNFFGELVRYAKDRAMDVVPGINSLGHNTLFPANLPEVAPKDENGQSVPSGFCTSSEDTYKLLFSVYDQIIDEYLIPNDIHSFNILLDEVHDEAGVNAERKYEVLSPWCKCEKCRAKEKKDLFIDHVIKVVTHLKEKGMTTVLMAHDMLIKKSSNMGFIGDSLREAVQNADLQDTLLISWWCYVNHPERLDFTHCSDEELGLRSICKPWNGYYIWSALTNTMDNIKLMADMNREASRGEGIYLYAMWDKSYDRTHDCHADYNWNYDGTGQLEDVTRRYVARHFPAMYDQCLHAINLMDLICEERYSVPVSDCGNPKLYVISHHGLLLKNLTYYSYCYFDPNKPYPRHFPGEPLVKFLRRPLQYGRELYTIAAMAKEAIAILREAAQTPGCDHRMARRLEYECQNYLCLAEDFLALMEMHRLIQAGDYQNVAVLARKRQQARLYTMELMEQVKEKWAREGAAMRELSVLMQVFGDIADYIEKTDDPKLDLMDLTPIMSKESFEVR